MDILIVADFIKKYSSEEEAIIALRFIKSFIAKRKNNHDYYIIFLNSVGNKSLEINNFNVADLESEESNYYKVFDEILMNPIQHISISLRHNANPFELSNPPMKMIFESINNYLLNNNSKINNIYIINSSGCPELQQLKNSFLEYIDNKNIHLINASDIKNKNIEV